MRAVIAGAVIGFRLVDGKGGKVGQVDLLQAATDRQAAKVIPIYIPGRDHCRAILETMQTYRDPILSLLATITATRDGLAIDVQEILSITPQEAMGDGDGSSRAEAPANL